MNTKLKCAAWLVAVGMLVSSPALAADHADAPGVGGDNTAADINDVYTFMAPDSPEGEDWVVGIMTVYPFAGPDASFSDAVAYTVSFTQLDADRNPAAGYRVDCTFPAGEGEAPQTAACQLINSATPDAPIDGVAGAIGETLNGQAENLRVYTGLKDDPFFFDLTKFNETVAALEPKFEAEGTDALAGSNVLAIVVGVKKSVLTTEANQLLAVSGVTTALPAEM